jgi:hypothetical protein
MAFSKAREHDCSGHWQAAAGANPLKKALKRHNFIPGPWGVFQDRPVLCGDNPCRMSALPY